ncbi:hypothetical protein ABMA28_016998 [Loxostege sticticalis]|uniref:Fibronectin type-III domain-containing protein n=1 Tax=Loxostege sticticalis TaxID=481309 RepID=A0ABD0T6L7_LOXSC
MRIAQTKTLEATWHERLGGRDMRRAPLAQPAAVALALSLLLRLVNAGSMGPGVPENITVTFLNPTTVKVSWSTTADLVEKYDVTYKPSDASYRVVLEVAGNSDAVILSGLEADTQYQVTVAALWGGHKYRSRPIHMRWSHTHTQSLECEERLLTRCNRPRVNSAIFVSAEPSGFAAFDAGEFLRRHGSQSKLCRKARSADNIPLTSLCDSSERLCKVKPREETINEEATSKSDDSSSVETVKHFGLPILSVSGPSPPDEDYDQIDEYL